MKTLVAYFSAEGTTAAVARALVEAAGADIFEIKPEVPYTAADLKWTNPLARCNREKLGGKFVPAEGKAEGFSDYGVVMLGFPIWYYGAPNIINTFCRDYDWTGKKVYIFATSGGSGIGKTAGKLAPYLKGAQIADARVVRSAAELGDWIKAE